MAKYKFSDEALLVMASEVGSLPRTPQMVSLYNRLDKAWWYSGRNLLGFFYPPLRTVELSDEEVSLLKRLLGKGDGTVCERGYEAREELGRISKIAQSRK